MSAKLFIITLAAGLLGLLPVTTQAHDSASVLNYLSQSSIDRLQRGERKSMQEAPWQLAFTISFARSLYTRCPDIALDGSQALDDLLSQLVTAGSQEDQHKYRFGIRVGEVDAEMFIRSHGCSSSNAAMMANGLKRIFFSGGRHEK